MATLVVIWFVPWAHVIERIRGAVPFRYHITTAQSAETHWVVRIYEQPYALTTTVTAEPFIGEDAAEQAHEYSRAVREAYVDPRRLLPDREEHESNSVNARDIPAWVELAGHDPNPSRHGRVLYSVDQIAFGWPFRALRGERVYTAIVPRTDKSDGMAWRPVKTSTERGFVDLGPLGVVPCLPVWRGLVLDVLAVAIVWWVVLWGASALRRRRRILRGLCQFCKYDRVGLDAHAACPECGETTTPTLSRWC